MTRRIKIIIFAVVLFLCITGVLVVLLQDDPAEIQTFDISEYEYYINTFSSEEYLEPFSDVQGLLTETERIWVNLYGESVKEEKPYQVHYDKQADVWLVCGTIQTAPWTITTGGVAYILVENNSGKVLAVWHEK